MTLTTIAYISLIVAHLFFIAMMVYTMING